MGFFWDFFFEREIWRAERQYLELKRKYLKYSRQAIEDPTTIS